MAIGSLWHSRSDRLAEHLFCDALHIEIIADVQRLDV